MRALGEIRRRPDLEVIALVTTCSAAHDRVSMHGVRRTLIEAQAAALGLPLHPVFVATPRKDAPCPMTSAPLPADGFTTFASNDEYESKMAEAFIAFRNQGVRRVVFGDIFLEDLKDYRDRFLTQLGLTGLYPLWQRDSRTLAREFVELGFQAQTACVSTRVLDSSWTGRFFDHPFLDGLPANVDPCGENGEFHTFVFDGPGFLEAVPIRRGEVIERDGFAFCDLVPA